MKTNQRCKLSVITLLASIALVAGAQGIAIDFSSAGYGGSGEPPPSPKTVLRVQPTGGDDTAQLQAAIDQLSALPPNADGFRGALLLEPGEFLVAGQLHLRAGGVVLRGAPGTPGTTVKATGTSRRTLLEVQPTVKPILAAAVSITDQTVAVGGLKITVASPAEFKMGDSVVVTRPCTAEWVASLTRAGGEPGGAARSDWSVGSRELHWNRTIVGIDPAARQLTLDAPITTAIESRFGGGTVARVIGNAPLEKIGIERLVLESAFDSANPKDEAHAWFAIHLDDVQDVFVRNITARHFVSAAVHAGPGARRVTIQSCRSEQPVSELGGYRREAFLIEGQQVLVMDCYSEAGMIDFGLGLCAAGPNVFLRCESKNSLGPSGAYESWASGALFEQVKMDGAPLRLTFETNRAPATDWTAANCVVWNCQASEIAARGPNQAPNLVTNSAVSLYEAQLKARGKTLAEPTVLADTTDAPLFHPAQTNPAPTSPALHPFSIIGGRFVVDGKTVWGPVLNEGWWRGNPVPAEAQANGGISASRFIPGRIGFGLTEDLDAVAAIMEQRKVPFYAAIPGLWYDRRRDRHVTVQEPDGAVLAPFLESPWARSGQGTAADGLSKFDLTQFNDWYFERYREMAQLCAQHGFIMVQHLYDTHNVLEIIPHWADYPFRPINNINGTGSAGIAEPPATTGAGGSKNFHQANEVYDIDQPLLRDLHRRLILHSLDELGDQPNLLFSLSFQFVGPLKFQQFFQDTVAEWEKIHRRKVKIALITTKDITDAILSDPIRSKQVAMIDTRYWQYRPDGSLFAPPGGQNIAFRESVQKTFPGNSDHPPATTPEMAYRQVREYRDRYPQLAISAWNNGVGQVPSFMAGASLVMMNSPFSGHSQIPGKDRTPLDDFIQQHLAQVLMTMTPHDDLAQPADAAPSATGPEARPDTSAVWALADVDLHHIVLYANRRSAFKLGTLPTGVHYAGIWFNTDSGAQRPAELAAALSNTTLPVPETGYTMLYLKAD